MNAASIARSLGGKPMLDGFLVPCPVPSHGKGHGDRRPSLLVKDGHAALLVKCFAGCDARDVLDTLRGKGLLEEARGQRVCKMRTLPSIEREHVPDKHAIELWHASKPAVGSVVERYLQGRGITIPAPASLRYVTEMMIAAVQRLDGKIIAVQTTLLTPAGTKATGTPRITHGALGRGAVRLAHAGELLGIAEGTETALAAMQLTGVPTWACLGAGRMHRVNIPDCVRDLHIFGDNDEPGRNAAERTAAEQRHRRVVLRFPPSDAKDWNDFLHSEGGRTAA